MTPAQRRQFNTIFGGLFIGLGIIAWILTFYFAMTPNEPAPAPVLGAPSVDLQSCRTALAQLGYTATLKDHDVTAFEPLSANPKDQLERASTAALVCKLPLKAFCMGDGCEQPGLTLVVRKPVDRTSVTEKAPAAEKAAEKPGDKGTTRKQ